MLEKLDEGDVPKSFVILFERHQLLILVNILELERLQSLRIEALGWWVAGTEKEARPGWGPSSQLGAISFYEKEIIQGFQLLRIKRFPKNLYLKSVSNT